MNFSDPAQVRVFFEIHEGLPRQSCGSDASTVRALGLVAELLPSAPQIADMACGPGSSAIPLAQALPNATILALDMYPPFIEEAAKRADATGVSDRVNATVGNMTEAPVEPNSLDMIWCEGGIYNIGVKAGMQHWAKYLKPSGVLVFNEPIWLVERAKRPAKITNFWVSYPSMQDDSGIRADIASAGFDLIDHFDLPESDWWDAYYTPMETKLSMMETKYAGDAAAAIPLGEARREIAMRRKYPDIYNYRFYCTKVSV